MFLFRCKSCLNSITRCFMKFEAKRTPPVVWAESQFIFWHWIFMYWATTLYPGPLCTSKHDRSIFMMRNCLTCWKLELVDLVFHTFWYSFCWIFRREMGQNGVLGQLMLCFAPFSLQWYSLLEIRLFIYNWYKSGQLVVRYDRLVVKSGVYAAGN